MLKLTPQQYADILESLQRASSSDASDKRECTRREVQAAVRIGFMQAGRLPRWSTALTRDISMSGIGLCQSKAVSAGDKFLLCLPGSRHEVVLACSAVFCRPLAEGIFYVGAKYESLAEQGKPAEIHASPPPARSGVTSRS